MQRVRCTRLVAAGDVCATGHVSRGERALHACCSRAGGAGAGVPEMRVCVAAALAERLHQCGGTGELVKMLGLAVEQASIDHQRCLAATLALFNMSCLPACAQQMAALKTEALLSAVVLTAYSPAHRPQPFNRHDPGNRQTAAAEPAAAGRVPDTQGAGECSEAGCAAAFLLRQLVCKRECQARLVEAEVAHSRRQGDGGGGSMMSCLCNMMRDAAVCGGKDPVGNDMACDAATAAVGVLQNLLAENEAVCRIAIKCGAVECLKSVLRRWIDRSQHTNPPELPSEAEDSSDGEEEDGEDDVHADSVLPQQDGVQGKGRASSRNFVRPSRAGESLNYCLSGMGIGLRVVRRSGHGSGRRRPLAWRAGAPSSQ